MRMRTFLGRVLQLRQSLLRCFINVLLLREFGAFFHERAIKTLAQVLYLNICSFDPGSEPGVKPNREQHADADQNVGDKLAERVVGHRTGTANFKGCTFPRRIVFHQLTLPKCRLRSSSKIFFVPSSSLALINSTAKSRMSYFSQALRT